MMQSLRKFGAWLAVGLMLAAPAMACLDSGNLTISEQECCMSMGDTCGSSAMPDSHSCCSPRLLESDAAIQSKAQDIQPLIISLACIPAPTLAAAAIHVPPVLSDSAEYPPGSIAILRI